MSSQITNSPHLPQDGNNEMLISGHELDSDGRMSSKS